jgi:hypothetical protein
MLFAANGHESCPLFGTHATSIAHEGNWPEDVMAPTFNGTLTRTLFKGTAHAVWPSDMLATCEYLRRYKGDSCFNVPKFVGSTRNLARTF